MQIIESCVHTVELGRTNMLGSGFMLFLLDDIYIADDGRLNPSPPQACDSLSSTAAKLASTFAAGAPGSSLLLECGSSALPRPLDWPSGVALSEVLPVERHRSWNCMN
jgi:hypothetical protein